MTTFKYKPSKIKFLSTIKTVDELHKEKINYFDKQYDDLPEKKKKLSVLQNQLQNYNKINPNKISQHLLKKKSNIIESIDNLKLEINKIENNIEELEYYLTSGPTLLDYYDIININKQQTAVEIPNETIDSIDKKKISTNDDLNKLNEYSKSNRKEKKPIKKRINSNLIVSKSILSFLSENDIQAEKTLSNKATLQHEYLSLNGVHTMDNHLKDKLQIKYCNDCKNKGIIIEKTLIQSEGIYVCKICGEVEYIIIESEFPGHKDNLTEKPRYPYKKINHLIEKLNQFQSKETTNIPEDIYNKIEFEIKKRKLNIDQITPRFIKDILKKYRLTLYYEHTQYIYSKITKNPPPLLTREEEEKIKKMFKLIEEPFNKYKPFDRSNFLNYSFVIHKILILLNKPDHAAYFNLLKSKEKLKSQDKIWAKICNYRGWDFNPSI